MRKHKYQAKAGSWGGERLGHNSKAPGHFRPRGFAPPVSVTRPNVGIIFIQILIVGSQLEPESAHLFYHMTQLLHLAHLAPEDVVPEKNTRGERQFLRERAPDVVSIVDLVPLAPFLVQQLLELFVRNNLLVPVQDCNVEVCIVVSTIRPGERMKR